MRTSQRDYVVSPKIADGLRSFGFYISNITIFWKYCADLSKRLRRITENSRWTTKFRLLYFKHNNFLEILCGPLKESTSKHRKYPSTRTTYDDRSYSRDQAEPLNVSMTPSRFTGKCKWVHFLKAIFLLCNSQINPLTFNRKNKTETQTEMADEASSLIFQNIADFRKY